MVNTSVPTKEQCLEILKKHNISSNVLQHCLVVTQLAEEFCYKIPQANREITIAGAMLHDIGRSMDHSICHAIKGVTILENEQIDARIIAIVKNHIGTGITMEEAIKLGLPPEDYLPTTLEEEIVSYSDNLVKGSKKVTFEDALRHFVQKFGKESHVVKGFFRQKELLDKMIK